MHEAVASFLQARFHAALRGRPLGFDDPLFSSGIVDSFGVLELIAFLEDTFHVSIDPSRYELTAFDSVNRIVVLVSTLAGAR